MKEGEEEEDKEKEKEEKKKGRGEEKYLIPYKLPARFVCCFTW